MKMVEVHHVSKSEAHERAIALIQKLRPVGCFADEDGIWGELDFLMICLKPTPSPLPLGEPAQLPPLDDIYEEDRKKFADWDSDVIPLQAKIRCRERQLLGTIQVREQERRQFTEDITAWTSRAFKAEAALATKAVPIGEGELPAYDVTEADRNRARGCEGGPQAYAAFHMRERQLLQSQQREREWKKEKQGYVDTIVAIAKSLGYDDPSDPNAKEWPEGLFSEEISELKAELSRLRSQERPDDAYERGKKDGFDAGCEWRDD